MSGLGKSLSEDEAYQVVSFKKYEKAKGNMEIIHQQLKTAETRHVSDETYQYAHPMDATIVHLLDRPVVNEVFEKIVRMQADLDESMTLLQSRRVDEGDDELGVTIRECAEKLGIPTPLVIISPGTFGLNAETGGAEDFTYIKLSPSLLDVNTNEKRFVIGHECGHIAMGHVQYHLVAQYAKRAAAYIPIMGNTVYSAALVPLTAWSRRSEITADRAGLICCGDLSAAVQILMKEELGISAAGSLSEQQIQKYLEHASAVLNKSLLGKFNELTYSHPITLKRIEALRLFAHSSRYYRVTGKLPEEGEHLLNDEELNKKTEEIISVINLNLNLKEERS